MLLLKVSISKVRRKLCQNCCCCRCRRLLKLRLLAGVEFRWWIQFDSLETFFLGDSRYHFSIKTTMDTRRRKIQFFDTRTKEKCKWKFIFSLLFFAKLNVAVCKIEYDKYKEEWATRVLNGQQWKIICWLESMEQHTTFCFSRISMMRKKNFIVVYIFHEKSRCRRVWAD